jgi:hypothetical protein
MSLKSERGPVVDFSRASTTSKQDVFEAGVCATQPQSIVKSSLCEQRHKKLDSKRDK